MIAAVILLREDGAALLQHRDNKLGLRDAGMWVPPGGHCEPDESIESCARREFLEETGYRCANLNWLNSFLVKQINKWPPLHITVFWARYDGVQSLRCLEGQALQFIERDICSSYPIPSKHIEAWDLALSADKETR